MPRPTVPSINERANKRSNFGVEGFHHYHPTNWDLATQSWTSWPSLIISMGTVCIKSLEFPEKMAQLMQGANCIQISSNFKDLELKKMTMRLRDMIILFRPKHDIFC